MEMDQKLFEQQTSCNYYGLRKGSGIQHSHRTSTGISHITPVVFLVHS